MSDDLRQQIDAEFELLDELFAVFAETISKAMAADEADLVVVTALASVVHSFYSGMENILKRIAIHFDQSMPRGEFWHSALLKQMATQTSQRRPIISPDFHTLLYKYLEFRHKFRHAYAIELQWSKMKPFVTQMRPTYDQFKSQILAWIMEG